MGEGHYLRALLYLKGKLPDSDKLLAHRPPQPPVQGCVEEALLLINKGTRCTAKEVPPLQGTVQDIWSGMVHRGPYAHAPLFCYLLWISPPFPGFGMDC